MTTLDFTEDQYARLRQIATETGVSTADALRALLAEMPEEPPPSPPRKYEPDEKATFYFIESYGSGIIATKRDGVVLFPNADHALAAVRSVSDETSADGRDGIFAGHCLGSCRISRNDTSPLKLREHKYMENVPLPPGSLTHREFVEGREPRPVPADEHPDRVLVR